jgi:hypothetical protein
MHLELILILVFDVLVVSDVDLAKVLVIDCSTSTLMECISVGSEAIGGVTLLLCLGIFNWLEGVRTAHEDFEYRLEVAASLASLGGFAPHYPA